MSLVKSIFLVLCVIVLSAAGFPAQACDTAGLQLPDYLKPFFTDHASYPNEREKTLIAQFQEDKEYYDELVFNICNADREGFSVEKSQKSVNLKIRALIAQKWAVPVTEQPAEPAKQENDKKESAKEKKKEPNP